MTDYLKKAKDIVAKNDYVMISKTWCPDCVYTYRIWDKYKVRSKIHIIELDKFPDQKEAAQLEAAFTQVAGRKWVPTIFLKGERFDEGDLKKWELFDLTEEKFKSFGLL